MRTNYSLPERIRREIEQGSTPEGKAIRALVRGGAKESEILAAVSRHFPEGREAAGSPSTLVQPVDAAEIPTPPQRTGRSAASPRRKVVLPPELPGKFTGLESLLSLNEQGQPVLSTDKIVETIDLVAHNRQNQGDDPRSWYKSRWVLEQLIRNGLLPSGTVEHYQQYIPCADPERIRRARIARGVSRSELMKRFHEAGGAPLSETSLYNWESAPDRNRSNLVYGERLTALALALELPDETYLLPNGPDLPELAPFQAAGDGEQPAEPAQPEAPARLEAAALPDRPAPAAPAETTANGVPTDTRALEETDWFLARITGGSLPAVDTTKPPVETQAPLPGSLSRLLTTALEEGRRLEQRVTELERENTRLREKANRWDAAQRLFHQELDPGRG